MFTSYMLNSLLIYPHYQHSFTLRVDKTWNVVNEGLYILMRLIRFVKAEETFLLVAMFQVKVYNMHCSKSLRAM